MPQLKNFSAPAVTLMEMLITVALFASILAILMTSFIQFQNQKKRMDAIVQLRQESRILERIIRRDLQNAIYLDKYMSGGSRDNDGRKSGIFGIDDSMGDVDSDTIHMHVRSLSRFFRRLPFESDPAIHEVSYYLEETDQGGARLKRREEFYIDPDITGGGESIIHTLSENVRSFDIKYYRGSDPEELNEWDSTEAVKDGNPLPSGFKVTMKMANPQGEDLILDFQVNLRPDMGAIIKWD